MSVLPSRPQLLDELGWDSQQGLPSLHTEQTPTTAITQKQRLKEAGIHHLCSTIPSPTLTMQSNLTAKLEVTVWIP